MIERNTGVNDILKALESDGDNITITKKSSGIVKVSSSLNSNPITIEANHESLQIFLPELNSKNVFLSKYKHTAQPLLVRIIQNIVEEYTK